MAKSSFFGGTGISAENTTALESSTAAAAASETAAAASATSAASSAASASANVSTNAASAAASEVSRQAALAAKTAAETAETNAETAETNSETAETNSASSATASANSATASATSATASEASKVTSGNSATASANSATASEASKVTAASKAADAETARAAAVVAKDAAAVSAADAANSVSVSLPKSGGAMSGAITTNSTFDGRDVATDGAKLDGIEANATADQTGAQIKSAYQAETNAFTDAQFTKLSGIEASATADQTPAQLLTAIKTVDGAGTGLDADLLDGQEGSYFTGYTDTAVSNLVDSSPAALNTLNELAAALGDDVNFSTTVTNSIATKAALSGAAFTGAITTNSTVDGVDIATRDAVLTSTTTTANAALPKAGGTMTGPLIVDETTAVTMSAGTTAQRPTGVAGMFRYNTTEDKFEGYSTTWGEIGGGAADLRVNSFTGDGSTVAYTLTTSPDLSNTLAYIDGVYQVKAAYAMSGQVLTFTEAPDAGSLIEITAATVAPVQESTDFLLNNFTGNGSTTAYTLSAAPTNENQCSVFISGVYQSKANFSVSGSTLSFSTPPPSGSAIEVMVARTVVFGVGTPDDGTVTSAKLSGALTTPSTLAVTGALTGTNATFTTADNTTQLTLASTDADAAVGPVLDLFRNSASPANFDTIGKIVFSGEDDGGNKTDYVHQVAYPQTVTGGSEQGYWELHTLVGGTDRVRMEASATEVVINNPGIDSDFRVESDGNTHALFVEGSSGNMGIGTSTPSSYYTGADNLVIHQASGEAGMTISTASNTSGALYFADGTSGAEQYMGGLAYNHSTNVLALVSGGAAKAHLDGSGRLIVGGGITLGNGQTYAAANTLDDYEEGTWTLTIATGGGSSSSVSIGNTTGSYTKIGRQVTATIYTASMNISAAGSGVVYLGGLPFNCSSGSKSYAVPSFGHTNCFIHDPAGYVAIGDNRIVVTREGTITANNLSAGDPKYMMMTVTYFTDS